MLAQLIYSSSHGVISDKVSDSAWRAILGDVLKPLAEEHLIV